MISDDQINSGAVWLYTLIDKPYYDIVFLQRRKEFRKKKTTLFS